MRGMKPQHTQSAKRTTWQALQTEVPEAVELVQAFGKRGWIDGMKVVKDGEELARWTK